MTDKLKLLEENLTKVLVGQERTIRLVVTALAAGGHVLLEDMPGTGKTVLAKSLAASIGGTFERIQMTPDLMPSDVTGLNVYNPKDGSFSFHPGPVFANIVLADEVNRAMPRTQAGLLECMEERQVTIDGVTRELPPPFFVIATQNPIETAGTFPLPEAQMDRFLMRLRMEETTPEQEVEILKRNLAGKTYGTLPRVLTPEELCRIQKEAADIFVHPQILSYVGEICRATRHAGGVLLGASPRGTIALLRASMAYAYVDGRDCVTPEDVRAVAVPVLAHRIILDGGFGTAAETRAKAESVVAGVPVPTEDWKKE